MKLLSITLNNFLSHVDTTIVFDDARPYLFVGVNGSGKSSLIKDSITYALFGKARGDGAGDDLIRGQEKKCWVSITFSVNGIAYSVTRLRVRNTRTELTLKEINGTAKDLSGPTATVTQKEIEKILGFNEEIFSLSACLEQGGKLNFSELTPKAAKDILLSVLRIDRYGDYEKAVRTEFQCLEKTSIVTAGALDFAKRDLASFAGVEAEIADLTAQQLVCSRQIAAATDIAKASKQLSIAKVADAEALIADWQGKQLVLKTSFDVKNVERGVMAQQLQVVGQTIVKLRERAKRLGELGGKCSMCGSVLTIEHIKAEVEIVQHELQDQLKTQETINEEFKKAQDEIIRITNEGNSYNVLGKQAELKDLNSQLSSLSEVDTAADDKSRLADMNSKIAVKQEKLKRRDEIASAIKDFEECLVKLAHEQKIYKYLLEAFGKDGIPAMIISNMVFEMEYSINSFLRRFSDRSISVKLVMERELKVSKELSDTFEIVIRDGAVERPYQLYSGGEKFRIDLSIRLALAQILARRNNFTLETLILDEPAFLDKRGLASLKDILAELSSSFSRIFVVSHLTELIDDAGSRFNVVEVGSRDGESFLKRRA